MRNDNQKEALISVAKSLFSAIPYAGTALTELLFDYNGRIKQNRLNHFIEILSEGFTQNSEIPLENIKTEHFNDLFESVLKRVVTTKSESKLRRFKDILINELKCPTESETVDIYLDLINNLSENEILILHHHRRFGKSYVQEITRRDLLRENLGKAIENKKHDSKIFGISNHDSQIREIENEIMIIKEKHRKLEIYRKPEFYDLDESKYFFYIQRLYSQALLIDIGVGRIGTEPFYIMSITEFGTNLLKFLNESEN
ncbi:MAG: hypothetical protein V4666_01180 [Bacteroidota bacterium]